MEEDRLRRLSRGEYSTARDRAAMIAGAPVLYTLAQVQEMTAVSRDYLQSFLRSMGLPTPAEDQAAFSVRDVDAIISSHEVTEYGVLGPQTEIQLLRAVSHTAERLAWWQFESLVDDAADRYSLDAASARLVVLDKIADLADIFEAQITYAWRRHLSRLIMRIGDAVGEIGADGGGPAPEALPLERAVAFADLVGYTAISAKLNASDLDIMVQAFMRQCRDLVSRGGGRVVKELGDGVMFVTDEPRRAAEIALDVAEQIGRDGAIPPARVGLVWGRVLGRFGDVFGPSVNLASRLSALAAPSEVLVDAATAQTVVDGTRISAVPLGDTVVAGVGPVTPYRLTREESPAGPR
ncbi:MAG: adenylate/guanylate cyclase domain-containing protein [Bifidobacteriaceae bacterium]|jgi:adenylate cyclase|nr:adenylate/guanylate cyclase domain-containing protein [Bifidobacteriaceae bacterium]